MGMMLPLRSKRVSISLLVNLYWLKQVFLEASGQVLTSTGNSISWTTPFDGNYNTLTNKPTIPAAQINSDWNASSGVAVILNKPLVPPLPSVTLTAAGSSTLTYNAQNGEFTFLLHQIFLHI